LLYIMVLCWGNVFATKVLQGDTAEFKCCYTVYALSQLVDESSITSFVSQ